MNDKTVLKLEGQITATTAARLTSQIKQAKGAVCLVVDSEGGLVSAASEIAAAIEQHPGPSYAIVGRAESAAVVPTLACKAVGIVSDGHFLLHAPLLAHDDTFVNQFDLAGVRRELAQETRLIAQVIADRAWKGRRRSERPSSERIEALMNARDGEGTVLDADRAVRYGLANRVVRATVEDLRHLGKAAAGKLTDQDVVDRGVRRGLQQELEAMRAKYGRGAHSNGLPAGRFSFGPFGVAGVQPFTSGSF